MFTHIGYKYDARIKLNILPKCKSWGNFAFLPRNKYARCYLLNFKLVKSSKNEIKKKNKQTN